MNLDTLGGSALLDRDAERELLRRAVVAAAAAAAACCVLRAAWSGRSRRFLRCHREHDVILLLHATPSSTTCGLHLEPHRAAEQRRLRLGGAIRRDHEQHRAALASEMREPHGELARERGRAIDHQQRERPAPQDHIGAPGRARRIVRTHHPQSLMRAEVRPVARRQRARRIDVRHPLPAPERRLGDPARDGRLAAAPPARAHDLREPAARQPPAGQRGIERREPGRHRRPREMRGSEVIGELLLESGERHLRFVAGEPGIIRPAAKLGVRSREHRVIGCFRPKAPRGQARARSLRPEGTHRRSPTTHTPIAWPPVARSRVFELPQDVDQLPNKPRKRRARPSSVTGYYY